MTRFAAAAAAVVALAGAGSAEAHPLGNFTVNRYAELVAAGDRVYVVYVLDMAEIPAFQARREGVDARRYVRDIADGLVLEIDGRRAALHPLEHSLRSPAGAGGLRTLRLEVLYSGPRLAERKRLTLRDRNGRGRLGWREMVARATGGARLAAATVPAESASRRLARYPSDLLASPPAVTRASAVVIPGPAGAAVPALAAETGERRRGGDGGFVGLADRDFGPLALLAALAAALFWGAAHALSPGHGKAIVAAYLVGSRGAPRHALALGGVVTVTHTIGVFALGLVTLALSQFVVPERLYPWLGLIAGLLVVAVGGSVLRARWRHHRRHARGHNHDHAGDDHGHSHAPAKPGWRGLVAVGVSGGLLPCPSALVVLLAAISLHEVTLGLLLIVAFSVGLAATITAIGLVAVLARRAFQRASFDGRLLRLLPAVSACAILAAGIAMTLRALPQVV